MFENEEFVHLYLLPLGASFRPEELESFLFNIPREEKDKIFQYKNLQDRQRIILGKILLYGILKKYLDLAEVKFNRTETGRPYFSDWKGDFNLSHSGEWIVAAITKTGRVGVDVEKIGAPREELYTFVLSEEELMTVNKLAPFERTKKFYELWTMKESIYKTGLFPALNLESINTFEYKKKDINTHTFYIDPYHPMTICWNGSSTTCIKTTLLTRDELMSFIYSLK